MLTHEEALLAANALYNLGFKHAYIWGDDIEGWHVRASKRPPLSLLGWSLPTVEINRPEDLAPWMREKGQDKTD